MHQWEYPFQQLQLQQRLMRCYSKQVPANYFKYKSFPRNYTHEKRMRELYTLKDSETHIGKYKYSTQDQLGKGFSSKVYKAVEIEQVHKRYAIKVIELKKFRGSNLEMLQAQIDIHQHLQHPNVLRLYEVIKTPTFYYLILQYCPHGTLHQYIRQRKKIPETQAVEIMDQVLAGYKYLIDEGVIHRDLKPANILRFGNKWKIGDLGFAIKSKYAFKDHINVGTPLYMSPESLKKNYYSVKTDIFALGVILFQMVEGRTPWQSSNEKELMEKMKVKLSLPETVKDKQIRTFIKKSCHISQNKRMSKEECLAFQFNRKQTTSTVQLPYSDQLFNTLFTEPAAATHSRRHSILYDGRLEQNYKQNNQTLAHELLLTRHIYSCLTNLDSFMIQPDLKQVFTLTLFKWLLRLMSFLSDKNGSNFNLKNWNEYTHCKFYRDLLQKITYSSETYEKEYLELIKHSDIKVIRTVNRKFPDLCHNSHISQQFYFSLKLFLVPIIRGHNHSLMLIIVADDQQKEKENLQRIELEREKEEQLYPFLFADKRETQTSQYTRTFSRRESDISNRNQYQNQFNIEPFVLFRRQTNQIKTAFLNTPRQIKTERATSMVSINFKQLIFTDKIQALQSLYTIYRVADLRSHPDSQQLATEKLKVINNYNDSHLNRRDYLDLRRLLRNL